MERSGPTQSFDHRAHAIRCKRKEIVVNSRRLQIEECPTRFPPVDEAGDPPSGCAIPNGFRRFLSPRTQRHRTFASITYTTSQVLRGEPLNHALHTPITLHALSSVDLQLWPARLGTYCLEEMSDWSLADGCPLKAVLHEGR